MKNEKIIGKWELVDTVKNIKDFNLNQIQNFASEPPFKIVYFLPNAEKYWVFEGYTNNKLFVHYGGDEPILTFDFTVKKIQNNNYMFLNVTDYNANKFIMVLKQTSTKEYSVFEIGRRENINLNFVPDDKILGEWKTVSYVQNINEFSGKNYDNTLWLQTINFKEDGTVVRTYFDESWEDKWTKGKLLDQKKKVVSNYTFKTINQVEFMFLEWKMGNYVYGGSPAEYYVFIKNN